MTALDKRRRKKLQAKVDREYGYRDYRDDDVEVRKSRSGSGVFAVRQFLPGELVIEIKGQLLPIKHYDGSTFVMELDRKWYLEPTIPAAFLNHSCNPNTELLQVTRYTLGLIALCNIEAGTEITFDYQWPALDWIPRCLCGAPTCRGWVVSQDEVKKMQRIAKRSGKPR
jgi:SET domain-containing protein